MKSSGFSSAGLLLLGALFLGGCETVPETVPVVKQDNWDFEADMESRTAAYVALGYTRERILEILGAPRDVSRFKSDPTVEVLLWVRTVRGALHAHIANTSEGTVRVQDNILYDDVIRVYLRDDKLIACTVERERSTMERFGRRDHEAN